MNNESQNTKRPRRHLLTTLIIFAVFFGGLFIWTRLSPWPGAMIIRAAFTINDSTMNESLRDHAPDEVTTTKNVHYDANDKDAYMDVYYPADHNSNTATIVWVHGGGWVAGSKDLVESWSKILAGKGFSVVTVGYSLAPENNYPLPVKQVNRALEYLNSNHATLNINIDKLLLGGSSAGAQIVAQIALLATNPTYASVVEITPSIRSEQIKGMLLFGGPYDASLVNPNGNSFGDYLIKTITWTYTGEKDFHDSLAFDQMSIPQNLTADFPPSFVTAGNNDPLLPHSESLVSALRKNNVQVEALFFDKDYEPKLNHEYQFRLNLAGAQQALDQMISFAKNK